MDRRRFLVLSALTPVLAAAATGVASASGRSFGFAADGSAFLLDGKPFQIRAGELHPARIPVQYWRHRIRMAKALGLNTISVYVMWNHIERAPGVFDFHTENRDVEAFIRLCQAEGMWVLLRPGPYVCGEWDLGGIPSYLLRHPDIKLRVKTADDPHYMAAVRRFYAKLIPRMKRLMIDAGGPILMVQVENEYGSYSNDAVYLEELRQLWVDGGIPGPFYTEDGLGQVQQNHTNVTGGAIALSGGTAADIAAARTSFPGVPAMAGEVYPGWLTHWGDDGFQGADVDISTDLKDFMAAGLSFNLYLVHGGTSFGFYAGANADNLSGHYQPDITSYDYCAPITEQGVATDRYHAYREIIGATTPIPAPVPTITPDPVVPKAFASVWDNLPAPVRSPRPQPFEVFGQSFGFALYRKELSAPTAGALDIRWVHDYATVCVDGAYRGGFSRTLIPDELARELNVTNNNAPLALSSGGKTLDILVEGMGRTNYGQALVDRKGILESVSLAGAELTDWRVYPLPMDEQYVRHLKPGVHDPSRPGLFFRAEVHLDAVGDTYVDLTAWTKGVVWVNGHNLGRYWTLGPQHRLYCPAPWLTRGRNEIVVFDLHQTKAAPISFAETLG